MNPLTPTIQRSAVFLLVIASAARAGGEHQNDIKRARDIFRLLVDEKYDAFHAACDDRMRTALPAAKVAETWKSVIATSGAFKRELRAQASDVGEFVVVNLVCKFERGALNVRVTLDKQQRVAGLFFQPAPQDSDYQPPPYADPTRFTEEEVTVSAGEFPLGGTLTLPVGPGPFPGVVLVHGSGPHDRDETVFGGKVFKDIAWGLATRGVAVLRYEKRTLKYGAQMDPKQITIETETVDDAVAAARLMMTQDRVNPAGVVVAGHSLGASAAPYIAEKEPRLAGIALLAAAARPIYELVEDQIEYLAAVDGEVDDAERERIASTRREVAALRDGTWTSGDTLLGAPAAYWSSLSRMDPVRRAAALDLPILILQGGRDYQVSMKEFAVWKKALSERKNTEFKLFDSLDHLLRTGKGPSSPAQYQQGGRVDQRLIDYLASWVVRVAAAPASPG